MDKRVELSSATTLLLYYITDRKQLAASESQRRTKVLQKIREAVASGVDFIQLREKDLSGSELELLAREAAQIVRLSRKTKLLINSRCDVAIAAGADGVHLRSRDMSPHDVRKAWSEAGCERAPVFAVSCHAEGEIARSKEADADFAVFGPVFEKKDSAGEVRGLDQLHAACMYSIPVFALGGITSANAAACLDAGARGIAGIRLFQDGDMEATIAKLRQSAAL